MKGYGAMTLNPASPAMAAATLGLSSQGWVAESLEDTPDGRKVATFGRSDGAQLKVTVDIELPDMPTSEAPAPGNGGVL